MITTKMKQVTHIDHTASIDPRIGIGDLKLGMNCFYLRDIMNSNYRNQQGVYASDFDQKNWSSNLSTPVFQHLDLNYKDVLTITINLFKGEVSYLTVNKGFKGKVYECAGIGDPVRTFYQRYQSNFCEFEDDQFFFFFDNRYGLLFYIGEGNECEDFADGELFETYLDRPVRKITIFDNEQRLGIGADLPVSWKR